MPDKLFEWTMNFDDALAAGLIEKGRMTRENKEWIAVYGVRSDRGDRRWCCGWAMAEPQAGLPPPDRVGQIGGIVNIIKGLSLTHVLIIALLVAIAIPTYIL